MLSVVISEEKPLMEQKMNNMTKGERLRRVVLLCSHFTRNLAYYRSWHARLIPGEHGEILATIDGNFIDMAVLEWCKLFGDQKGKHYWSKVVGCQNFESDMLDHLNISADQFQSYITEMRRYRDQFLAHLDDEKIMQIPSMETANMTVRFLHQHLVTVEASPDDLAGLPDDLTVYYEGCVKNASSFLDRCNY